MKTKLFSMIIGVLIAVCVSGTTTDRRAMQASALPGYVDEPEQTLTLDNWMFNDAYWTCMENNCLQRDYDVELPLESWMTEIASWENAVSGVAEKEESLELETWMSNGKCWERNLGKCTLNRDCLLTLPADLEGHVPLDSWRTDEHVWSNEYSQVVFVP
jgi:hypothetical protein